MAMERNIVSYEFIRKNLHLIDKFAEKKKKYGLLYAMQDVRELRRLHTYYPGQRTELDYTKYGVWLFPSKDWNEPLFFCTGTGVDHYSTCIKGFTVTVDPSARDAVRLYRNCVLPKSLWLPENLKHHAQQWDVFGTEDNVALDNAMDLIADAVILMFVFWGIIVLRMPPRRGDFKGTVERTQYSMETQFISALLGYVSAMKNLFSHRYTKMREAAKNKANLTVTEYQEKLVGNIMEYNHARHPRLKKSRIQVWRDGQEHAPIILPTGELQIRATFALTFACTLTREGVQVLELMYNSPELHLAYRIYTGKVIVKLNPDDIRAVLVIMPNYSEPIEATLTTFEIGFALTQEMFRVVMARLAAQNTGDAWKQDIAYAFPTEMGKLQSGETTRTPGKSIRTDAQAATHAANIVMPPASSPEPAESLESMLRGSLLNPK